MHLLRFLLLLACVQPLCAQQEVSIQVFSLFHAQRLVVEPAGSPALVVRAQSGASILLNGEGGRDRIVLRADQGQVLPEMQEAAVSPGAAAWTVSARDGGPADFRLSVPQKIARRFEGRLVIRAVGNELAATVAMSLDTAVASVVAAEMPAATPIEALKAQAIIARSFLAAGGRHAGRAFCDTTHCQYLRSPPSPGSQAARATAATHGMILSFRGRPLAAMYSSRCGGHTRSLEQIGIPASDGYPYYGVACAYCLRHRQSWQAHTGQAPPPSGDERARLNHARHYGWGALPGSDFTAVRDGSGWIVEGNAVGHGVGLCQYGAAGMAAEGAGFRDILSHYYPNTQLQQLP